MKNIFSLSKAERYTTVSLRPFQFLGPSVHTQSMALLIILIPQILMLAAVGSAASLIVPAAAVAGSYAAEAVDFMLGRRNHFSGITAAVQGIIIGLMLPSVYPAAGVFFITLFTLLLAKYAYGGFANSWVNPAAITVTVAWIICMTKFPGFQVTFDDLRIRNPSLALIQNGTFHILPFDTRITSFFNTYIFRLFGVSIPDGYISLFWDTQSIIPAFRFNLLTMISSIILIAINCIDVIIPACYLIVYCLLVSFAGPLFYNGTPGQGDMILALLSSGTLFTALFILQWYGTTPVTRWGKVCYGVLAGCLAFLIVGCGTSPVGSVFTVLSINILSPLIQSIEDMFSRRYLQKTLIPQVNTLHEDEND